MEALGDSGRFRFYGKFGRIATLDEKGGIPVKRHISIFAFLLGAFAAAVPAAAMEIHGQYYCRPGETEFTGPDTSETYIGPWNQFINSGEDPVRVDAKPEKGWSVVSWHVSSQLPPLGVPWTGEKISGVDGALSILRSYRSDVNAEYIGVKFKDLTYNVKYDENGGSSVSDKSTISYTSSFNLAAAPSKTGYTFSGWKDINGSGKSWDAGASVKGESFSELNDVHVDNHDVILQALWTANQYTVTFDGNDGGSPSPGSKTVTFDSTYGDLATCSRTGYTFAGWWTAASGGTEVKSDTRVQITADQTLYAHWTAGTYTVTFEANGGDTPSPTTKSVTYGSTYGTLATCSRTGYTFDGWWTAASGGTKVVTTTPVTITAAQTLYAHWTPVTYKISYGGLKQGATNPDNPTTYTIETPAITFKPPTAVTGFTFTGWEPASIAKGSTKDKTVTAKYLTWIEKPTPAEYELTYNGGLQTIASGSNMSATGNQASDPGDYTATFLPNDGYCWKDGTVTSHSFDWKIVNAEMENVKAYQTGSLTYTGEPQQPTVYTRADVKGSTPATWKYSTYAGGYAATLPSFTDAGKYTVYYEVTAPGHNPKTGSFDVVVNRAREARVSLSKDQFFYTGREQGPDVTFTHCTEASGSVRKATEVDTYYVKAKPDDNYAWGDGGTETRDFAWRIVEGHYTATVSAGEGGHGGWTHEYATSKDPQAFTFTLPTRTGYRIAEWTASGYEGEPPTISGTTLTIPARTAGDFAMTPTWEPITYTIDFDGNGGEGEMEPKTLAYDETYVVPDCGFVFTGATFRRWTVLSGDKAVTNYEAGVTISNLTTVADAHLTFRAEWQTNSYEVVFLPNGAKGTMSNQKFRYGEEKQLTKLGFVRGDPQLWSFEGWTNSAAGGPLYADQQVVSNLTAQADGRVELTAVWSSTIGELSIAMGCDNLKWESTSLRGQWIKGETVWTNASETVSCAWSDPGNEYALMQTKNALTNGTLRFWWKSTGGTQSVVWRFGSDHGNLVLEDTDGQWREVVTNLSFSGEIDTNYIQIQHQYGDSKDACYIAKMTWTPEGAHPDPVDGKDNVTISSAAVSDGKFMLSFTSDARFDYNLLTNANLLINSWGVMANEKGTGEIITFEPQIIEGQPQLFYKVETIQKK